MLGDGLGHLRLAGTTGALEHAGHHDELFAAGLLQDLPRLGRRQRKYQVGHHELFELPNGRLHWSLHISGLFSSELVKPSYQVIDGHLLYLADDSVHHKLEKSVSALLLSL